MRPEDLLTRAPTAEAVARETRKLPQPAEEARESLRRSLEAASRPATPAPWPALLQEARGKMDSRYAEPATSHRGGLAGLALVVSKRAFRRVFQPFINEALRKQVEFNESILDALATIHDVQREHARTQALWRQEVDRRLARIEAATSRGAARDQVEATLATRGEAPPMPPSEAAHIRPPSQGSTIRGAPSAASGPSVTRKAAKPSPATTEPQPSEPARGGTSRRRNRRR